MKTQEFGSVSKAALYSALGFAKNHKETDFSSCYRCPHYRSILQSAMEQQVSPESLCGSADVCRNCKKQKSIYTNEANRYGSDKGRLNAGSVLLFLYLHLCSPTGTGVVPSFSISEAAAFLGCDHKTVRANLQSLVQQNYILYSKTHGRGLYTVMLLSYTEAFKPAKEGGRGYVTISKDLLLKGLLPERRSLNLLRLDLRSYMETDNSKETHFTCKKSMEQLRLCLPDYLRPGMIHTMVTAPRTLYSVKHETYYSFSLNPELNARLKKLEKRDEAYELLESFLSEMNSYLAQKREDRLSLTSVPKEYVPILVSKIRSGDLSDLTLGRSDFEDILQMSVQYSIKDVFPVLLSLLSLGLFDVPLAPKIRTAIIENFQAAA